MSPQTYALLERVHGHVALLAVVLLAHPLVTLGWRQPRPWTRRTAALGAALLTAAWALGYVLYADWRRHPKPRLVLADDPLWLHFERKEHLAFLALALVLGGVSVLHLAPTHRAAARALLGAGVLCGLAAAVFGVYIAGGVHPGW